MSASETDQSATSDAFDALYFLADKRLTRGGFDRLRARGLHVKRNLARREFALGIESLERFARREPLYRVHECAFGVLALESEPTNPRL